MNNINPDKNEEKKESENKMNFIEDKNKIKEETKINEIKEEKPKEKEKIKIPTRPKIVKTKVK